MKNILKEKSNLKIKGRLKYTTKFVKDKDLSKKKVLDIGCGYGWFIYHALKKGAKAVMGTEISASDLKAARESIKDKRASFKIAGALKLPFKENTFDTVTAWEVIEHIPKDTEQEMFKEVNRILKPGGVFYLSTPFHTLFSTFSDPAFWITGHRHYKEEQLHDLGVTNGFKIVFTVVKGRFRTRFNLWNMYISKWVLKRGPIFDKYFNSKLEDEYKENNGGFIEIFVKYKKIKI